MENDPFTKENPNSEADFLTLVMDCIREHMGDSDFSVELLGSEIGFSRSQLYRKLFSLTGFVPGELIRNLRLKQAARILDSKATPEESAEIKGWLSDLSVKTANAAKEGGFLGFGGTKVSENEKVALQKIADKLGVSG